jgi:excisionase family DNA binding protein
VTLQPLVAARVDLPSLNDLQLIGLTLERDEAAWRELQRRHTAALREAARDATGELSDADIDDLISDLWLSLIHEDKRLLRSFNSASGAAFLSWLTMRLSQIIFARAPRVAPTLLRVEEVARRWGIDRKTVYAMIERGQLVSRRCGRLVRIPRAAVESFELQASASPERTTLCR